MPRPEEQTIYGMNAVHAAFSHRPDALRRAFFTRERRKEMAEILRHCAAKRLPYREVEDAELQTITRSEHHEGVALVTRPLSAVALGAFVPARPDAVLLVLDDVGNPHNLGAILRSAASFGATGIVVGSTGLAARLSPAAIRVAQGGAEVVPLAHVERLPAALEQLRRGGYRVIAAEAERGVGLYVAPITWPVAVVLGAEDRGLAPATRRACDALVSIPGTGAVQSLNVSVAAGVVLAELWRRAQQRQGGPR
jgi:TrmH RNA methyltransferase